MNSVVKVSGYSAANPHLPPKYCDRLLPQIRLHCPHCDGVRNFRGQWRGANTAAVENGTWLHDLLAYTCNDCAEGEYTYAIISVPERGTLNAEVVKIGEFPEVYPELPKSVGKLLGDDFDLFKKGLSCEKRGCGIGAFAYYRRAVEAQKGHLLAEILRVAEKLNSPADMLEDLRKAAEEHQFSRAIDEVKKGIPESLFVDGHNPLKMLHDALSIGIHGMSDEDCLTVAQDVRHVLVALAERIKLALAEKKELSAAVSRLASIKAQAKAAKNGESK